MAAVIGALRADLSASVAKFESDLGKAAASLEQFGKKAQRISANLEAAGQRLTAAITLPILAFGASTAKAAGDYEQSMNRVRALTNATGEDLDRLKKQARELGAATQFSASDAADAMGFLAMAGMKVNDIIGAMPHVLTLAGAAQLDMAKAADIVTNVMAGYALGIDDLSHANDVLAKAFTSANTDLTDLAVAMKYAGPVAQAAGVQFEETAAALSMMGNAGIQGSMAGTSLRGAISRILGPTKQMADAMKAAGLKFTDAQGRILPLADILQQLEPHANDAGLFMTLFGQRAGPAMAALVSQGSGALRELTGELENAGGTAAKISGVQMEGFKGLIKELQSAFEELQLRIAESGLLTFLGGVVIAATEVLRALSQLPDPVLAVLTAFAGLAAVVGPLLWMAGAFVGALGHLAPVMALIATAAADLAAPLAGLVSGGSAFLRILGPIAAAVGFVIGAFIKFRGAFEEAFGYLVAQFQTQVQPAIANLVGAVQTLFSAFDKLLGSGPIAELVNFVQWAVAEIAALLMQGLGHAFLTVVATVADAVATLIRLTAGVVETIALLLSGDFSGAWEKAKETVADFAGGILDTLENLLPGVTALVQALAEAVSRWVGDRIADVLNWIEARFPGFVSAVADMARGAVAWAKKMVQDIKTWINDNLGPVIRWARDRIRELNDLFAKVRRRQADLQGRGAKAEAAAAEASTPALKPGGGDLPPELTGGGGGGGGGSSSNRAANALKQATERMREALEDVNDSVDRAFGRRELPRSIQQANDLRKQLTDMEAEARAAGVSMGQFAAGLQKARDRIRELELEGLAAEAKVFDRQVRDMVASVSDLGSEMTPLDRRLASLDDRFGDLRERIQDSIDKNRVLAESNDDAKASMERLEQQLARLSDAYGKAVEGAKALDGAEQKLKDLQAARDRADVEQQISDLQRRRGDKGVEFSGAANLRRIEEDLMRQRMDAQIELASLQADLIQAQMDGDLAQVGRLQEQIALQSQLYELVSATTAEQIQAAERLQQAFSRFADDLSSELTDMVMEFRFDLDGLRGVFKQLARDLFVKPVTDSFASGIGGFLKSFAGGFAVGGTLKPGEWGIAGENGPEPIFAGAASLGVMSNPDAAGMMGRGRGDVIFNVRTPNADSFRQSQRQLARRARQTLGE
nr:phage tail tape measure protein [Brevundimonas naejangsanensis]